MVSKLLKYDLKSIFRILLPSELIVLGISVLLRIIQFTKNDSIGYSLLLGSSIFLFASAMIVCIVMAVILSLVRYYKNMFTAEGYLTLTLPVKSSDHIFSKMWAALIAEISTALTCIVAIIIASSGTPLYNFINAVSSVVDKGRDLLGANLYPLIIEGIIAIVFSEIATIALYYTCLTMGQLVKKRRLLMAFVFYFGYIAIVQTVSTVLSIIFSVVLPVFAEQIETFMASHIVLSAHLVIWLTVIINVIFSAVCILICNGIIKKKLNLE